MFDTGPIIDKDRTPMQPEENGRNHRLLVHSKALSSTHPSNNMVDRQTTPFKRPRTEGPIGPGFHHRSYTFESHAQKLISELQQSITSQQRVTTLKNLLDFVGYDRSTRLCRCPLSTLSRFVEGKCIHLLCLQLGYALGRCRLDQTLGSSLNEEIFLILTAIDLFYRYCPELVTEESMRTNGAEVLRLSQEVLVHLLQRGNDDRSTLSFLPIVSLWHSCSSDSLGTIRLLEYPGTLSAVQEILEWKQRPPKEWIHHAQSNTERIDTIMECLGLLKNLTYFGEDHRHQIVHQNDLIRTLTSLTDIPDDKARERLSAVFRNLALSSDVRPQLTQKADVLTAMVRMVNVAQYRNRSPSDRIQGTADVTNSKKNTLRNVLSIITSLATDTNATHWMVFHGDGILIEQLQQLLSFPNAFEDSVVRKRACRALRLIARDPSSATVILKTNHLLEILSKCALEDPNEAMRTEAMETFASCANLVHAPLPQHTYVLDVLTHMLLTALTSKAKHQTERVSLDVVGRALHDQSTREVNRKHMVQRNNLVAGLSNVLLSENATLSSKESVCATLKNLCGVADPPIERCRNLLSIVLEALVGILVVDPQPNRRTPLGTNNSINSGNDATRVLNNISTIATNRIREVSVRALLNLAERPSNRTTMAKQTALIQSLLRFAAAATTSDEMKKDVKVAILQLAAEL